MTSARYLTRRAALLMPFALAACGGEPEPVFEPLRYNYLPPIQLNVASIQVEQRFIPSGVPPDVSNQDPEPPLQALTAMANDRLQAFGTANKAVFGIQDASLTRENDVVTGSFAVSLTIFDDSGAQLGFAQAHVESRHTGRVDHIRSVLYDMTKSMMTDMNVEFEYQVRKNLKNWLTDTAAPDTPVDQAPLDAPNGTTSAPYSAPGGTPSAPDSPPGGTLTPPYSPSGGAISTPYSPPSGASNPPYSPPAAR